MKFHKNILIKQERHSSMSTLSSSRSSYSIVHCQCVWWAELTDPWRLV